MQNTRLEKLLAMLRYAIATEYVKLNDDVKALHYYLDLLNTDENYVGTYYHLAKLYERSRKNIEAEGIYMKGMMIARKLGENHAYAELQSAYNKMMGLDYEDE
jgi:Tfp pilus assembly protein PilF